MTERSTTGEVSDAMVFAACNAYFDALPSHGGESANFNAMRAALEAAALPVAAPIQNAPEAVAAAAGTLESGGQDANPADRTAPLLRPDDVDAARQSGTYQVAAPMGGDALLELVAAATDVCEWNDDTLRFELNGTFADEVARLRAALTATPAPPPAMQAEIDRLRADAERYRWLHGDRLDAAIDAARARDAGEVGR